jgi:hypothetical protein
MASINQRILLMSKPKVLIVQELWWPKGGGGILATHLITKVLVRHGFEVRVVTGVEDHEVVDNVVFIHEPRLRASNKLELWFNAYIVSREGWFRKPLKFVVEMISFSTKLIMT